MDCIMIERTVYDAMVSALYECRELLAKSVNKLSGNMRQEWIDNHFAQAILCRSQRSMAIYPANGIGRLLINNYERHD